jgi:ribonuclease BN (tRNA processing enzyme)
MGLGATILKRLITGDRRHSMGNFLKFLGTAGARFVVAKQLRYSAGTYLELKGERIILDPGPGTLVRCASSRPKIDPASLDTLLLSHSHIDHTTDVNVLIDAMTGGGLKKRGKLYAPLECLEGRDAVILPYLRDFLEEIVPLEENRSYSTGNVSFTTSSRHLHKPETYGFRFALGGTTLSFMVDGKFSSEITDTYKGSDVLVLNVVLEKSLPGSDIMHLSLEDVRTVLSIVKPGRAILTHFGMTMIRAKPHIVAERLSEDTGMEVIAARDGMKVDL